MDPRIGLKIGPESEISPKWIWKWIRNQQPVQNWSEMDPESETGPEMDPEMGPEPEISPKWIRKWVQNRKSVRECVQNQKWVRN